MIRTLSGFGVMAVAIGLAFAGIIQLSYAREPGASRACLEYSYSIRGQSWNDSVETCRGGTTADCLDFVFKLRNNWNDAMYACQFGTDAQCLNFVYNGQQLSFNTTTSVCKQAVKADCLDYVYNTIKRNWNESVSVCRNETRRDCLEYAVGRGDSWNNVVWACATQ